MKTISIFSKLSCILDFSIYFTEIELIYNLVVGSGVQQSDSVFSFIYIHIYSSSCSFPFWFTTGTEYSFLHCDLGPSCLSLLYMIASVQFSSVAQSRSILCDPMNRSTPGLPVHHQLVADKTSLNLCSAQQNVICSITKSGNVK